MTANITFQCLWGQQPAVGQESQSWVSCGKTAEIPALDINFSVLSCHSQQSEKQDSSKELNLDRLSTKTTPLWKRDSHTACCGAQTLPLALLNQPKSPSTSLARYLQRSISWPLHHSQAHVQLNTRRDPKSKMHVVRAESQVTLLPLKYLSVPLGHRALLNRTNYGKFYS